MSSGKRGAIKVTNIEKVKGVGGKTLKTIQSKKKPTKKARSTVALEARNFFGDQIKGWKGRTITKEGP